MKKTNNFILGLDIGTNSIGWAMIEHDDNQQPSGLIACGPRIFQEAVEAKTKTPKNKARRDARSARRLVSRRKMRRNNILNLLLRNNLLPEDANERKKLFADNELFDPYQLREKALDNKLEPYELGRALYHLAHRRGFQSNRKATSKEDGKVKSAITSLRQEMEASKSRTLGEYLANKPKRRNRYTDRSMYEEEFELTWQSQQKHYPELLTQPFKVAIYKAIFFQRPLKLQKGLVGKCTFEPSRKRASRALLEYQRYRILQDLNNLEIKDPISRDRRSLMSDEREKLLKLLEKQKTMSWDKARKLLNLHKGETFNLEEGKKKELIGNRTACTLRSILEEKWDNMSQEQQNALITDMFTIDNEQGFLKRMHSYWNFDAEVAEKLATTELEPGYARLSLKAIRKILPYFEQGMKYDEACRSAGYDHSNPNSQTTASDRLGAPPHLRNPVVEKALYETRKLINSIVQQYGKPSTIRIEMARDMKLTRRQKEELQKKQKANEKANKAAEEILHNEFGIQEPSRADIQKYNMWLECNNTCPYTGTVISREMLFSQEVEAEHILPYSRSLDDSYMNKTLCMAEENRKVKHNKTPYEAYSVDREKYEAILQRIKVLPWPKRRRFEQKEIDKDERVERQLNDTRYICVEVKKYIQKLGINVEVSKGEATAALRHRWNLNRILSEDGSGEKNRADHRHHAIDAVVIALTSRSLFQKLSRLSAQSGVALSERGFPLDNPWQSFYEDVSKKVENIIVSHAPTHKITGSLHEETAYGYSEHDKCFVYRKPLNQDITLPQIINIRDPHVRELAIKRLEEFEPRIREALDETVPKKKRFKIEKEKELMRKAFGNQERPLLHKDGKTPIKSVRIFDHTLKSNMLAVKNQSGQEYKYYPFGNNHHIEIIEHTKTGKREGIVVTTAEAAKRARREKIPIVQRDHGPEWRFIMSLCINDIVEIADNNGVMEYYRVQKLSGSDNAIYLRLHTVTDSSDAERKGLLQCRPSTLPPNCRKVTVDCLGIVAPCND